MNNFLNCLGLARKANKVSYGENALNDIRNHKSELIIIAKDASLRTQKKIINKCNYYQINYLVFGNSNDLSYSINKSNIKVFSINDNNFAKLILKNKQLKEGEYNGKTTI